VFGETIELLQERVMADPKPDPQGHSCAEVAVVVCAPGGLAVTGGDEQFLPFGVYHSSCVVLRLK